MQSGFVQSDLEGAEKEDDLTDLDPASAQIPKAKVAESGSHSSPNNLHHHADLRYGGTIASSLKSRSVHKL